MEWVQSFAAMENLIGLGDEVLERLLAKGELQQLFDIITRNPSMYIDEVGLAKNLFLHSSTSTLQQMLNMNLLTILQECRLLGSCLTEALTTSSEVLDRLLELQVVHDLVKMQPLEISGSLICCLQVAKKSQIPELVQQGIIAFLVSCLQQSINVEESLKALLFIVRADSSSSFAGKIDLEVVQQYNSHNLSISSLTTELISLINSSR